MPDEIIRKIDRRIIDSYMEYFEQTQGKVKVYELWQKLKEHGFSFGDMEKLAFDQEMQILRTQIGRITDPKTGKRKYVNTKEQGALDFGEQYYIKAQSIEPESEQEVQSLSWVRRHVVAIIKRTPLLPQWAVDEIVASIERVFEKMRRVA